MDQKIIQTLSEMSTQHGVLVSDLSKESPVLVVFLRHFGCIFCMESMKDLGKKRPEIEAMGVKLCLVHMAPNKDAEQILEGIGLGGIDHVSDPSCDYYEKFGLVKGNFGQLYGLRVWLRTAEIAVKDTTLFKRKQIGDGLQMPGVFYVSNEKILNRYIHVLSSDRPDYLKIISDHKNV